MDYRFIAQRVTTGEFLDWNVPLSVTSNPRRDLSGPGGMSGTIEPEYGHLIGEDGKLVIDEWSTAIYAEAGGRIRWGGLVTGSAMSGPKWNVTCSGFSAYPHGIPYEGAEVHAGVATTNHAGHKTVTATIDAWVVVRKIWDHVQSYGRGDIGVIVDGGLSGYNLGAGGGSDPYELVWWDTPDCGEEIDSLAQEVPFDYYETHAWNASRTAITHRLHLDKRAGRRRQDLRFVQGENIIAIAEPQRMGDDYANTILAIGKGSGRKTLRVNVSRNDGHLRRVKVISHKRVGSKAKLTRIARRELAKHVEAFHVPMVQVKQHVNAPISSWQMGDEILLHLHVPHLGNVTAWHRIVAEELAVDGTAMLTLTPPGL